MQNANPSAQQLAQLRLHQLQEAVNSGLNLLKLAKPLEGYQVGIVLIADQVEGSIFASTSTPADAAPALQHLADKMAEIAKTSGPVQLVQPGEAHGLKLRG